MPQGCQGGIPTSSRAGRIHPRVAGRSVLGGHFTGQRRASSPGRGGRWTKGRQGRQPIVVVASFHRFTQSGGPATSARCNEDSPSPSPNSRPSPGILPPPLSSPGSPPGESAAWPEGPVTQLAVSPSPAPATSRQRRRGSMPQVWLLAGSSRPGANRGCQTSLPDLPGWQSGQTESQAVLSLPSSVCRPQVATLPRERVVIACRQQALRLQRSVVGRQQGRRERGRATREGAVDQNDPLSTAPACRGRQGLRDHDSAR
jgi:hypothetical protein